MPYFAPKLRETQGKSFIDCCLNPVKDIVGAIFYYFCFLMSKPWTFQGNAPY